MHAWALHGNAAQDNIESTNYNDLTTDTRYTILHIPYKKAQELKFSTKTERN